MFSKALLVTLVAACGCVASSAPARAQSWPLSIGRNALAAGIVRSYFDALRRQDEATLRKFTVGDAAKDTHDVLARIHAEAKQKDVGVELRLSSLAVSPRVTADSSTTAVDARFSIDVIAKKWFFTKVARELRGRATFYVGNNAASDPSGAKIVGIKLYLD